MVGFVVILGLILTGSLLSSLADDFEDRGEDFVRDQEEFVRDQLDRFEDGQDPAAPADAGVVRAGGAGDDLLRGGAGDDRMVGNLGDDTLEAGAGDDRLFGRSGDDQLFGEGGDDSLFGENGFDLLTGGAGDDLLNGGEGADVLEAGIGNDTLGAGTGDDTLRGDTGNDQLSGGFGQDLLQGGPGADTLQGDGSSDMVDGGTGGDIVNGGEGDDIVIGYARPDGVAFVNGQDPVFLTTDIDDPDELIGGAGDDQLILGRGDAAYGTDGEDNFVLGPWMTGSADTGVIADFEPAGEEILILVPETYTGAGVVEIVAENQDALVRMDGQSYALVIGAAGSLTPAMVSVVFTPSVVAA